MAKKRKRRRKSSATLHRRKKHHPMDRVGKLRALGFAFSIMIVILVGVGSLFFSFGRMTGYSMMPEVSNDDVLLIAKQEPKRFELIYLKTPHKANERSVRRVIGVPGDEIYYRDDQLFVNGQGKSKRYLNSRKAELVEGYLTPDFTLEELTGKSRVPSGHYFVLGDNRQAATDSREYQFVKQLEVIGVVTTRIYPLDTIKHY